MDAITLLLEDHQSQRKLCKEFAGTTEREVESRKNLLGRLEIVLRAQTSI